ncbi:MAG: dihydroorotase [Propionibacteriaceae bacterium]|jgi:dihydroorotase|nr:dihydroorotase [Propionibacteriaceae bacterium]
MADLLIRDVTLPDGSHTDLGIHDDRLVDASDVIHARIIDASGLVALPGLVDLHTHLREPSPHPAETVASGTAAAARGGFTAVFAMANTDPTADSPATIARLLRLATTATAEVIPIGAITVGLAGAQLAPIAAMHAAGVTYFSDDGHVVMDASLMRQALLAVREFGGMIGQHSQDHQLAGPTACLPDRRSSNQDSRKQARLDHGPTAPTDTSATVWPRVAEAVIVARDVQLARDTGARVHVCHVSTAESIDIIRWAKRHRLLVTAEVTPHHLLLDQGLTDLGDTTFKVNPPLRSEEDRFELRRALADGTIDIVATDHAPHTSADKALPFPQAKPGMVGLEQALAVVMETMLAPGLMDWSGIVERMSYTPARLGQIATRQGRPLTPGEPANFVLIDPTARRRVDKDAATSMGRNNPYDGLNLPDPVISTWWRGHQTFSTQAG